MPRLPVRFYGILVFVCTYVIVHSFQDNGRTISFIPNGYDLKDQISSHDDERNTRTVPLAFIGNFAVSKLLKGAKQAKDYSYQFRKYEKEGDANTAIKDFYSIKPEKRKIMNIGIELKSKPGTVMTGLAGDRRVVLLLDGDKWSQGRPVLEVIDTKTKTMPNIDRIVYKKHVQ